MNKFPILVLLGTAFVLGGCSETVAEELVSETGESFLVERDEPAQPLPGTDSPAGEGATTGADGEGAAADDGWEPDPDKVVDILNELLTEVVTGKAMRSDMETMRRRLIAVLEDQRMGSVTARFDAADVTLRSMFRARDDQGGPAKGPLLEFMKRAIRVKSEEYTDDLYRRLPLPGAIGLGRHDGELLKRAVDIEIPDGYDKLQFATLGNYEYVEGMKLPESVTELSGKKIGLAGYIITLEEVEDIREFLLVESIWSCCFGTPPMVHEVIVAQTRDDNTVEYTPEAVMLLGTLEVGEEVEDGFVTSLYRIKLDELRVAK